MYHVLSGEVCNNKVLFSKNESLYLRVLMSPYSFKYSDTCLRMHLPCRTFLNASNLS